MPKPKSNETRKIEGIATAFGLSVQTIRNWKTEGCNIFDPAEIISWRQDKIESRGRDEQRKEQGEVEAGVHGRIQGAAGRRFDLASLPFVASAATLAGGPKYGIASQPS